MRWFFFAALLAGSILFSAEDDVLNRVYAHLSIHDPASAVVEAEQVVKEYPHSKRARQALIQALCANGRDVEALKEWEKRRANRLSPKDDHFILETLAWGVLHKADTSSQGIIQLHALLGASFTRDAKAIPLLMEHLRGSNAIMRSLAVRMAASYGDGPLQAELLRMLKEEKVWYVKLEVLRAVGQLRIMEACATLRDTIAHPKTLVEEKGEAICALVNMLDYLDRTELLQMVKSDRAGLRQLACAAVVHLDRKVDLDLIIPLLKDHSPDVRISAMNTLMLLQTKTCCGKEAAEWIIPYLNDPVPEVAITAAWIATVHQRPEGREILQKWILSSHEEYRRLAAAALATAGKQGAALSAQLLKKSDDLFVKVNLAMGLIGQRQQTELACATIFDALKHKQGIWMWQNRHNPLFRSLSPSKIRHVEQVPQYPTVIDQMVQIDLLSILCTLQYSKAQEAVKSFLQSHSWGVSAAAAATILTEGDEQSFDLVKSLLNDPEEKIRVQAAMMLALFASDRSAVKVLQAAFPTVDREMKIHILEAVGHIGDPESIPFLLQILNEPFQILRVVAASALIQCLYH